MTALVEELVPDELWAVVEPLLPPPPRLWWGGRVRTIPARNCFAAIVSMARTSTSWRLLPAQELGCGAVGVQGLGGIPVAAAPVGQLPLGQRPGQGVTVGEGEPAGELFGEQQGAGKLVLAERLTDPVLGQASSAAWASRSAARCATGYAPRSGSRSWARRGTGRCP
jgi:hypothetical protein